MSRWWRDEIRVDLAPGRLELVRKGKGWQRRFPLRRETTLPEPSDSQDWRPALEALAEQLSAAEWRNAELAVQLSNHFVRYAVIGWDDALRNEAEVLAYARHQLHAVYGEAAHAWEVCLSDAFPGEQRVLAAIDLELMSSLRALAQRFTLRLASVEPLLSAVVDAHFKRFAETAFYLAVVEPSRVCFGRAGEGGWTSVHNVRAVDPEGTVAVLLRQELLQDPGGSRRVYICGTALRALDRTLLDGWDVVRLEQIDAGVRAVTQLAKIANDQAA